jgi:hypothetical protein
VTGNRGFVKVPMACLVEFKGILIFCRAAIPDEFQPVTPQEFEQEIEQLEGVLNIPFILNSMSLYSHPQRKYLMLTELEELIPRIPLDLHPPAYFRKECLQANRILIDDQKSLRRVFKNLIDENLK